MLRLSAHAKGRSSIILAHRALPLVPSCHVYVCPTTPPRRHAAAAALIPCSPGPHYSAEVLLYTCNAVPVRLHPSHPTRHPLTAFARVAMASSFARTSSICPWTSVPLCYVRVCTLGPLRAAFTAVPAAVFALVWTGANLAVTASRTRALLLRERSAEMNGDARWLIVPFVF